MQPKEYTIINPRIRKAIWDIQGGYEIGETTSPNVILFRLIWQYYKVLIENLELYLISYPSDKKKTDLLKYITEEWECFLEKYKKIRPEANSDATIKATNNKKANDEVRKIIAELHVLWKNPGDKIVMSDGTEIILEGVGYYMNDKTYKEYFDVMKTLEIKQMILQGPPGTSKTYSAKEFLKYMAGNISDEELAKIQITDYSGNEFFCQKRTTNVAWDIVQFHPSYGYEDFVRGIKVSTKKDSDTILYETVNKILGNMSKLAVNHKNTKFFLIIDEINRANLATVFGELIYGLEYRDEEISTPYIVDGSSRISIPDNLYIIGTMNTADKSIGGIDYAIRRRFLFFEQLPNVDVIRKYKVENVPEQEKLNNQACKLFENVEKLFQDEYLSPEYRKEDVQIGHTYFLVDSIDELRMRFEYQIIPILKEYYKDGIINFDVNDSVEGLTGFLNCIGGKINIATQKETVENIFNALIV